MAQIFIPYSISIFSLPECGISDPSKAGLFLASVNIKGPKALKISAVPVEEIKPINEVAPTVVITDLEPTNQTIDQRATTFILSTFDLAKLENITNDFQVIHASILPQVFFTKSTLLEGYIFSTLDCSALRTTFMRYSIITSYNRDSAGIIAPANMDLIIFALTKGLLSIPYTPNLSLSTASS